MRILGRRSPAERAHVIRDIQRIPLTELPLGGPREALLALAATGIEVDTYWSSSWDRFTIWLRPDTLAGEGRMTCAEWRSIYRQETDALALRHLLLERLALWRVGAQLAPMQALDEAQVSAVRAADLRISLIRTRLMAQDPVEGQRRFDAIVAGLWLPEDGTEQAEEPLSP